MKIRHDLADKKLFPGLGVGCKIQISDTSVGKKHIPVKFDQRTISAIDLYALATMGRYMKLIDDTNPIQTIAVANNILIYV